MRHADRIRKRDHIIAFATATVAGVVLAGAVVLTILKNLPEEGPGL